jgi:hypothetical protein
MYHIAIIPLLIPMVKAFRYLHFTQLHLSAFTRRRFDIHFCNEVGYIIHGNHIGRISKMKYLGAVVAASRYLRLILAFRSN